MEHADALDCLAGRESHRQSSNVGRHQAARRVWRVDEQAPHLLCRRMIHQTPPNRCRIVLISPPGETADSFSAKLTAAVLGGDVASIILPPNGMDEASYQAFLERIVPIAQEAGIAAIVVDDTRIAGRVKADGIHIEAGKSELAEAIENLQSKMAVGAGGVYRTLKPSLHTRTNIEVIASFLDVEVDATPLQDGTWRITVRK